MSPETYRQGPGPFTKNGYGLPADIWSCGVLLYVLFSIEEPWNEETLMNDIFQKELWITPELVHRASPDVIRMMSCATRKEPTERPSISELVRRMRHLSQSQNVPTCEISNDMVINV